MTWDVSGAVYDWLAVNQFTVVEGQHNRRLDVVVFVNGLPLAVVELKNPFDEDAARPSKTRPKSRGSTGRPGTTVHSDFRTVARRWRPSASKPVLLPMNE
jgi:hypothetical protein